MIPCAAQARHVWTPMLLENVSYPGEVVPRRLVLLFWSPMVPVLLYESISPVYLRGPASDLSLGHDHGLHDHRLSR